MTLSLDYPLDFAKPQLRALRDLLAQNLFRKQDIEWLCASAGIDTGYVQTTGSGRDTWQSVLDRASMTGKADQLLKVISAELPALGNRINEMFSAQPVMQPNPTLDKPGQSINAGWHGFGQERVIVESADTLLSVSFLELGLLRSRSVCRLTATFRRNSVHGTGSLIAPNLLLTNHHVLHDWTAGNRVATRVEAWFDYELDVRGVTRNPLILECDASTIIGDRKQDWAVIAINSELEPGRVLNLRGAPAPKVDDYVFIIQHPEGGPKMIALSHNLVRHVDSEVLQYWTDTKAGSSGAPVFNSDWEVVGLHHQWVEAPQADGVAYRNQGRRIEPIIGALERMNVKL